MMDGAADANGFLLYGETVIDCVTSSFAECVLLLLAIYYAFNLAYPVAYSGVLGFLQTYILLDTKNDFKKSSKFVEFCKKYDSQL